LFHLFLFFHLSIGLLLFVCASGGGKDAPLLVVCVASKQKEGEKLTPKEGEKFTQKEGEKF
tara:strand:- start:266 stop:448 length:183 start_codon:yes stop_codon:yes gene_type:complete